jgi:NTP pyrophosphatase (non-canonical NTP hydrolase)
MRGGVREMDVTQFGYGCCLGNPMTGEDLLVADHRKSEKINGLAEFVKDVHHNAVEHGWYDEGLNFTEKLLMIYSEVGEVLEEYRNNRKYTETYYREDGKPEGIPAELADIVIRVFDLCGACGIDIESAIIEKHEFNKTRPYRHGGKRI